MSLHSLRRVPAPQSAPPYDDERPAADPPAMAGALVLPFPLPEHPAPGARLRVVDPLEAEPGTAHAVQWAARLVPALLEALAGLRSVSQLAGYAAPDVCGLISRRVAASARGRALVGSRGRVVSLHVGQPRPGVAEVCAIVDYGSRTRALALRLEADGRRWCCTALQLC